MGKVKQVFVDLEHEGPDQEPEGFDLVAVVVPRLLEYLCYLLIAGSCLVWLAIGSTGGRI